MKRFLFATITLGAVLASAQHVHAKPLEIKWDTSGYFRTRAITLTNLAPVDSTTFTNAENNSYVIPEIRRTSYIMSRLRLSPSVSYGEKATLHLQLDALDDVLWGDNNALASAPLFATDTSDQYYLGGEQDALKLRKAWVQFQTPVGVMRVGRMPSHWGMGLLANGGGSGHLDSDPERPRHIPVRDSLDSYFDDDFGDNHFGSVADRILFITKPLSIIKALSGQRDKASKLVMGYAYDKISEAPLLPAEPAGSRFRPFGQQGFLSRPGDDINEHVALLLWNDPYPQFGGAMARHTDELRVGTYWVWRHSERGSTQPSTLGDTTPGACGVFDGEGVPCVDTGSDVFIADFWARLRYGPLYSETELVAIFGETFGGVPFPNKNEKKEANIDGGVLRLGYFATDAQERALAEGLIEVGHASGDDDLNDQNFKQRALHPDFNVGLILFEETLRELSARTYGPPFVSEENPNGATGFFSNGGVINANYVQPRVRFHLPDKKLTLVASVLFAWVDTLAKTGPAMFYEDSQNGSYLGTEVDLAIKAQFAGNMFLSVEGGYLQYGPALRTALPNADNSFTLQSRLAFVW